MEASEIKAGVRKNHNVLVLGQAGTGKTSLLKDIYKEQKSLGRNVQITASTGIAATLLPGAKTVHSFFGILDGRFTNEEMFQRLGEDSNLLTVNVLIQDKPQNAPKPDNLARAANQIRQKLRPAEPQDCDFELGADFLPGDFLVADI